MIAFLTGDERGVRDGVSSASESVVNSKALLEELLLASLSALNSSSL